MSENSINKLCDLLEPPNLAETQEQLGWSYAAELECLVGIAQNTEKRRTGTYLLTFLFIPRD